MSLRLLRCRQVRKRVDPEISIPAVSFPGSISVSKVEGRKENRVKSISAHLSSETRGLKETRRATAALATCAHCRSTEAACSRVGPAMYKLNKAFDYASTSIAAAPAPLPSGPLTMPPATMTSSPTTLKWVTSVSMPRSQHWIRRGQAFVVAATHPPLSRP